MKYKVILIDILQYNLQMVTVLPNITDSVTIADKCEDAAIFRTCYVSAISCGHYIKQYATLEV